ncbi:hypothetical protein WJX73_003216 [Symbiochloris irregularis]|uniref:Starch synthase, chloroplastic/amyloplastic n=1 Tax=Symbiochloris irregularis TaxID=706552 RepID=A0AAW1P1P3_9CHLO
MSGWQVVVHRAPCTTPVCSTSYRPATLSERAACPQQRQRNLHSGLCRHRGYAPDLAGCGAEQSSSSFVARVSSLEQSTSPSPNVHAEGPDIDPSTGQAIPGKAKTRFNIVFVSSEVAPWSKTGGLGDVCGSLPPALAARGHRVMVIAPMYKEYKGTKALDLEIEILGTPISYYHLHERGVDWLFVDNPGCFQRPGGLYGDTAGTYGDNQYRFALLSQAALEAPLQLQLPGGRYGEDCLFIANDWHASMTAVYLAGKYRPHGVYSDARCILAIHNLRHQGVFPPGTFKTLGLPGNWYGSLEWQYPPHQRQGAYEEEGRAINTLKGGIITSDRVCTVSPGYAWEIQTPEGGWGLEGLLRSRAYALNGVLNGIDDEEWNPQSDPHIDTQYNGSTFSRGKAANKAALQRELGLPERPDVPLFGFIGRLDYQKGADLILAAAPWLLAQDVQLICLGTGESGLEGGMRWLENTYPDKARGWVGFNVPMSHKITAGCDLQLMPSRFEPCGLNQLYAMRYGTVPVAHATGGLRDTVLPFNPWDGTGTGWTFSPCTQEAFTSALANALQTFHAHPDSFHALQQRGLRRDSSWNKAAAEYEQIFEWAKFDRPYCS